MAGPDYFGDQRDPNKANWKKHENDVAKRTGDKTNRSSGAGHGKTGQTKARRSVSPGDNMGTTHIRECKSTRGGGITVQKKWLEQLIEQSLRMNRRPVLEIRLEGAKLPVPRDWVLIPALDYDELIENK